MTAEKAPLFEISLTDLALYLQIPAAELRDELKEEMGLKSNLLSLSPQIVREIIRKRGIVYPKKVISVQMLKGGVAKTTSVLNIGLRAAMYGARVLFVDLDQQANLTYSLGVENEDLPVWLDVVEKRNTVEQCVLQLEPHVDLIPSSLNNSVLDRVLLNSNRNWAQAVKGPLSIIKDNYDLILIDTAPALSATNTAVTVASEIVLLPLNPDKFSWLGLQKNLQELEDIKKDFDLNFTTQILLTKFDAREKFSHEILQKCTEHYQKNLISSYIRTSSEVKNTIRTHKTLFHGRSPAKDDYDLVAREIMGINQKTPIKGELNELA